MKKINLLLIIWTASFGANAQKVTAYAITAPQKGASKWCEIKLIDLSTGQTVESIHNNNQAIKIYSSKSGRQKYTFDAAVNGQNNGNADPLQSLKNVEPRLGLSEKPTIDVNQPFATRSAACAYDVKNNRLYFTPMGIPQLRYIDLKDTSRIYFVDDTQFGVTQPGPDVHNQITRMVFTKEGKGYALTNNAKHLIRFGGSGKIEVVDLGSLADDQLNPDHSVHDPRGLGGDMVADVFGNLYLVTGNHWVFRISIQTKMAAYLGQIEGLPEGFTTNGVVVEEDDNVIVCSSVSTAGYYRVSLKDLKAVSLSTATEVYNASDLANDRSLFEKKGETDPPKRLQENTESRIGTYPNPVADARIRLVFQNQDKGTYQVQLLDVSGKQVASKQVTVLSGFQIEEFNLPASVAKGNYVVSVLDAGSKLIYSNKLVIQ